ncbi:leucine-rich repeat-containing protein 71 isoform X2 [Pelobates fuscus]
MDKKKERASKNKPNPVTSNEDLKNSANIALDRTHLTAEDYQCTGILEQDFTELCYRVGYIEIPKVLAYPSTPGSEKTENSECADVIQVGSGQTSDRFSYFKPKIQIIMENEDPKSIKEISIRGWKIESKMISVLAKCLPALANLQTVSCWNVGLTDDTFSSFVDILHRCPNVRKVILEGTPLPQQSFHKLITDDLPFTHISLRNNKIDDEGARLLSQSLRSLKMTNKSLAVLTLAFNHISDLGACHIAEALRLHRALLSLNLASNQIGDKGALALAEILGHFSLTHTEIVQRRKLLMEKESRDHPRSPATSRHGDAKSDRPPSHQSTVALDKSQVLKSNKGSVKKNPKDAQKKEDKSVANSHGGGTSSIMNQAAPAKKDDSKSSKKQLANPDPKNVKGKPVRSATKRTPITEQEKTEHSEITMNPLLEQAVSRDGKIFLSGNKVLMNLNLTGNRITEQGLRGFLTAMETQVQESTLIPGTKTHTGLLRLSLTGNNFSPASATYLRLQELMCNRDPINKPTGSPEDSPKDS